MPIGLENFQPETFEQANPVAAGYAQTLGMNQMALQNQLLAAQAQYAPQNAQAASQTAQAQSSLAQFQAQNPASQLPGIAGQLGGINALQKLGLLSGQGSPASTPNGTSGIGLPSISTGAPPSAVSQSLPNLPGTPTQSAGAPTAQLPFSAPQLQDLAIKSAFLPVQIQQAQLALDTQRTAYYGNLIGNMSVQNAQKFLNSPEGQAAASQDPNLAAALTNKLTTGAGVANSTNGASAVQALAANKTASNEYTPQQLRALPFAKSFDLNMAQVKPLLPDIGSYTTVQGQGQYLKDRATVAAGGQPTPAYQAFTQFEAKAPAVTTDLRQLLGDHATDYQTAAIKSILDPKEWDQNPTLQIQKFQSLVNSAHATLQAFSQTKAQAVQSAQSSAAAPPLNLSSGQPSQQIAIPSNVKDKASFNAFFNTLSPAQQTQLRSQLPATGGQ